MTNTEIVANIDQRLTQAKAEIARLEGARQALTTSDASGVKVRPRGVRPRTTPRKSVRRATDVVSAAKLAALLDGSTGMSTAELAKATGVRPDQLLTLLRELEKADRIRRTGIRRSTRWHLITDEDRIAARTTEIAAQSKRRSAKAV